MFSTTQSLLQPPMTNHARVRSQQRSIPAAVRDALIDFGERRRAGHGADPVFFTKKSWKRLEAYMGSDICRAFEKYRNCYLIEANDGAVVTVAYRS
jgi:hypothetical protein